MTQAKAHYDRGLQLYDDGAYDGARVEFERAYELAPTYRILYNIGRVQKQQQDYAGAFKNFEAYLEEGGSQVPDARRVELTKEIADLRARTATVTIATNVPGADVFVDDVPVGKSPLKLAVRVNPGRRKVSAAKQGRLPATKVVEVAGSDRATVALDLAEPRTVVIMEKPPRRVPWIGWVATGVLAIGAGVAGYFAIDGNSKLSAARDRTDANPNDLTSRRNEVRALSIIADSAGAAAVIVGGVSLYYTITWGKEDARASTPNLAFGASGTF
ncbi:tetratricopeptide repeat protein [Pendulispora albinea]|uniref:Tetratricopeptide repeat protein n=1 Tax=Pendulispora albinea TaxID=2741071 RepID=A0ABZ2LZC5_9BACT